MKKIGILGGGQLARMMLLEASRMGMDCWVMSSSPNDPAAQVTNKWLEGDIKKSADVLKFAKKVDLITFESEFVSPNILEKFIDKKIKCYPSAKHMLAIQDRLPQKEMLAKHKVPTSPFYQVDSYRNLTKLKDNVSLPLVLKARRDGYDGKGTYILKSWSDESVREFYKKNQAGVIAEHFIPFKRELAVSLVRNTKGEIVFFPLVESYQEECRCLWVKGPVEHKKFKALKKRLKDLVDREKYVGFISFELFDDGKELMVNEIAPRVHNSAHYSQNALSLDQFSAHLKAVAGDEMKEPKVLTGGFAMYNLIGSTDKKPKWNFKSDVFFHWYGKADNRPGRKMGHLNINADGPNKALKKLIEARKEIKL
jgi:5-(carboxyamino)imidazole ribonucleotide synthase